MEDKDIEHRFAYHRPLTDEATNNHKNVRSNCKALAHYLDKILPDGREKSLAITHLEEAMMWANASIARNQE